MPGLPGGKDHVKTKLADAAQVSATRTEHLSVEARDRARRHAADREGRAEWIEQDMRQNQDQDLLAKDE